MNKSGFALIAAGCLSLAISAATAQQRQQETPSAQVARAMDANSDGVITREEFLKESSDEDLKELFSVLDSNEDGVLEERELPNLRPYKIR